MSDNVPEHDFAAVEGSASLVGYTDDKGETVITGKVGTDAPERFSILVAFNDEGKAVLLNEHHVTVSMAVRALTDLALVLSDSNSQEG